MDDLARDEATAILNVMFRNLAPDDRAILCSVTGDPSVAPGHAWGGVPWALGAHYPLLSQRNNYVAISSFRKVDDRWRRRKDQFVGLHAIMIDDVGTKVPRSAIPHDFSPTLVVETSPGNYQVTYFLAEPQLDQEVAESSILQMIASVTGGGVDPGMSGVTRVLRLPGGVNGKPKYYDELNQPWRVRVERWRPDDRIRWADLAKLFGLVTKMKNFIEPDDGVTRERRRGFGIVRDGLNLLGVVKRAGRGWIDLTCPWVREHTDRSDTGAAIALPAKANGYMGGFRCHHGHCAGRTWGDLEDWVADMVIAEGRRTRGAFTGVHE